MNMLREMKHVRHLNVLRYKKKIIKIVGIYLLLLRKSLHFSIDRVAKQS